MKDQKAPQVQHTPEPEFNAGPLLEIVGGGGAADTAVLLDDTIHQLTQHFVYTGECNGHYFASMLMQLRELRNAILKGANIINFID